MLQEFMSVSITGDWPVLFRAEESCQKHRDIAAPGCSYPTIRWSQILSHQSGCFRGSDEAEFLWRLARASRDMAFLPDMEDKRKKELMFEGFEYVKKALEKDEKCSAAHKWYAICLSDVGDYMGVKVKIGNAYIIRDHLEKAIELNPKDATSFHILGYWCFAFSELPWYQRKVAAVIFSSPPVSTYEEALQLFLKAEEVDPNFYSKNLLMLGKTYLSVKEKEKGLLFLTRAKEYPAHTLEDKEVHKEAVELLKKLV
ncbi:hypothetical protein JOQ06_018409 [Pogonophryne albipinna]|uniref:Regulator of microtubule dynamics protein 1 n=1 Tax=Pogonophryne albipinna TaxID=1090488 RepID=A0AAD6AJ05_9TELE|nr:hypothetical protein JOQ06_018409 [Pogonophryne albipinna]